MNRQEEKLIIRLWRDWCRLWPEQYGHESLQVKAEGYDPVFDVIPSQAYKDFYFEVVCGHPQLRHINAFEIVDAALNQIQAPETAWRRRRERAETPDAVVDVQLPETQTDAPATAKEPPREAGLA